MPTKKYYLIYKTTNQSNGKYYIGQHATDDKNDNYLGSGVVLGAAIVKYGRENFYREILFSFDTHEEMNAKEIELVTEDVVRDRMSYNVNLGGTGEKISTKSTRFAGKKHTEESKRLMSRHHNRAARSTMLKNNWGNPHIAARMRKQPKQTRVVCPHCSKEGGNLAMKRYHFDNCKQRNII